MDALNLWDVLMHGVLGNPGKVVIQPAWVIVCFVVYIVSSSSKSNRMKCSDLTDYCLLTLVQLSLQW